MEEEKKRENSLEKLLESRGGFIEITEAIELLGPTEYTKCLVELIELEEGNPHDTQLFYKNGDSGCYRNCQDYSQYPKKFKAD